MSEERVLAPRKLRIVATVFVLCWGLGCGTGGPSRGFLALSLMAQRQRGILGRAGFRQGNRNSIKFTHGSHLPFYNKVLVPFDLTRHGIASRLRQQTCAQNRCQKSRAGVDGRDPAKHSSAAGIAAVWATGAFRW